MSKLAEINLTDIKIKIYQNALDRISSCKSIYMCVAINEAIYDYYPELCIDSKFPNYKQSYTYLENHSQDFQEFYKHKPSNTGVVWFPSIECMITFSRFSRIRILEMIIKELKEQ